MRKSLLPFAMITLAHFAPEGPKQVSPGQGNASSTSLAAALGSRPFYGKALKGRNKTVALPANLACCALSELITRHFPDPGRRGLIAALP